MATDTHINPKNISPNNTRRLTILLYTVIGLLLIGAGYLLYRNIQLSRRAEDHQQLVEKTVLEKQLSNDRQQLTFTMKAFSWAIRNALLQNKPGEINDYFNTLVKDRGVQELLLIDAAGKVTVSTNKKNQGIVFSSRFPAYLLQQQEVYFNNNDPYELSAPVVGPDGRLGTLVMFYKPTRILPDSLTR